MPSLIEAGELAAAKDLTERIRAAAEDLWRLVGEAHERRVWATLGYESWKAYVGAELSLTNRGTYKLITQYRVNTELEAAGAPPVSGRRAQELVPLVGQGAALKRAAAKPAAKPQLTRADVPRAAIGPEKAEPVQLAFTFDDVTALQDDVADRIRRASAVELADLKRTLKVWAELINAKAQPKPVASRPARSSKVVPNFKEGKR